jgi:hypothetical protein
MARKIQPAQRWDGFGNYNNFVPDGSRDMKVEEIYKILGLGNGSQLSKRDDPIIAISRAFNRYTCEAYPVHMPSFAARLALLKDLSEKASTLASAFDEVGIESFDDIEWGIEQGLDLKPSAVEPSKGYVSSEIPLFREYSADWVHKIAKSLKAAAEAFPKHPDAPPPGRPAKRALVGLIQDLADVYEFHTERPAYEGFAYDPETHEYDGPFFLFAWPIISDFDPSAAKTNNALGAQIRKALTDYGWQPVKIEHFHDDDFDFTDGKE